jgi:hypothetical protein
VTPPPRLRLERGVAATIDRLRRAEDGSAPALGTRVEVLDDGDRLHVRFDCDDPEPWSTLTARDAPLWQEEVVELFVAPGAATPRRYVEIEVNPAGALFDALVDSPHGDRRGMLVDPGWNCADLESSVSPWPDGSGWSARLALPWRALAAGAGVGHESSWRVNFFRIDRPHGAPAEFSAWSPTGIRPADFHRPARFGILERVG